MKVKFRKFKSVVMLFTYFLRRERKRERIQNRNFIRFMNSQPQIAGRDWMGTPIWRYPGHDEFITFLT